MRRTTFILISLLLLAACNLTTGNPPTPTSGVPVPTVSYTPPTPYRAPDLNATPGAAGVYNAPTLVGGNVGGVQSFSAQDVGPTATGRNILTPIPAQTLIANPAPSATSQNAIEAFVNNLIVPLWNFLYTFFVQGLATLWVFAGARGGAFAQVFCCITPAILLAGVVALRLRLFRWWRR